MTQPIPDVLAPAKLGPVTLRNRIIKSATYEGLSRDNKVTDALIDFHVRHAAGGVGMTTVAYCAVAPDGRTDRKQILWTEDALPGLRRLTEAVHAEGAAVSAQIGHAGPVANPKANGAPALGPSRHFHATTTSFTKAATRADLERIIKAHGHAARMAIRAGFDAVEIHLGHNYLASSFLSPQGQPPRRRVRRLAGEPRPPGPRHRPRGPRGGRRPDRHLGQVQHGRRRARRVLAG